MESIRDILSDELSDSLDCTRVWSAWGYGTMGQDDFVPVCDRLDEIVADVTCHLLAAATVIPRDMTNEESRKIAGLIVARRNFALAVAEVMIAEARLA